MITREERLEQLEKDRETLTKALEEVLERSLENSEKTKEMLEKIRDSMRELTKKYMALSEKYEESVITIIKFHEALEQIGFGDLPNVDNSIRMKHIARKALRDCNIKPEA